MVFHISLWKKLLTFPQQATYLASLTKDPKTGTEAKTELLIYPTGVFVTGGLLSI